MERDFFSPHFFYNSAVFAFRGSNSMLVEFILKDSIP